MVRVLLQLKVNRLCLVVDGTAGFDPKWTPNRLEGRAPRRSGGCFLETDGSTAFRTRFCFGKLFPTKAVARW